METQTLYKALIDKNPEKRWKTSDLRDISVDESTARRQFKKRFGMTFIEYARSRRIGITMKQIREGEKVIDSQLNMGYESASGFRDAFNKILGAAPTNFKGQYKVLKSSWLDSPLGPMLVISDEEGLYLLEFVERRGLEQEIKDLRIKLKAVIIPGKTEHIESIQQEMNQYFAGSLKEFKTSIHLLGSPFQIKVWQELMRIPYGITRSYMKQAALINNPTATRAVANANGANKIAIVIPCHRIINANGNLGGYGGGIERKKWLIKHEQQNKKYT